MFKGLEEENYGCWHCGEVNGAIYYREDIVDEDSEAYCCHCRYEIPSVVGLDMEALDTLVDLHRKGVFKPESDYTEVDYQENYTPYQEEDDL